MIYTAHYDHLGIVPGMAGDNIYNGAQDNATGCGILLEIARAFALAPQQPRRSIYFAAVTGEEQGLLGSQYLGLHPPVPAKNITLDLNYDDVPTLGVPEEVNVTGAERTNFYPTVESTARQFGLTIVPDVQPGAGHYYRSDHFSFARLACRRFPWTKAASIRATTCSGDCSRPPITWRIAIISRATSIAPTWIFAATR